MEAERRRPLGGHYRPVILVCLVMMGLAVLSLVFSPAKDENTALESGETESGTFEASNRLSAAEMRPFEENAVKVLTKLKYWSEQDMLDLPDGCGLHEFPCLDRIGTCILENLVDTEDGKVTPKTQVCSCFALAQQAIEKLPEQSNVVIQCPFHCVAAILKIAQRYVSMANGPVGPSLHCADMMHALSVQSFGNRNSMIADDGNLDSLSVTPTNDPAVALAADAFRLHVNKARSEECPALAAFPDTATVVYAKSGLASDGGAEYRMEVSLGAGELYFARVASLPKYHQLINPLEQALFNDTANLLGRFRVMSSTPAPCSQDPADRLAVSATGVAAINAQGLPWRASLRRGHEGRPARAFGMGYRRPSAAVRLALAVRLSTAGAAPPAAWDARDVTANQTACRAFEVLNQGSCGSCYAFSAATAYSARQCLLGRRAGPAGNVVVSPQQLMDCTNGCDGGNAIDVYTAMLKAGGGVELWCNPYIQRKQACGAGVCGTGLSYAAQAGSVRTVGGTGAGSALQMQLELLRNGPGVASFDVYDDLYAYASGVYARSSGAKPVGAHAVALLGWGVENNVPYWLIQNSWGKSFGNSGFFKMWRGTDECNLESYGLDVVQPVLPVACPNSVCGNGATVLKDCSCRCNGGWSGPVCDKCALVCQNGGAVSEGCGGCICQLGYFGTFCEGGFSVSPLAACSGGRSVVTVTYSFAGTASAPTQKSFIGIFKQQVTDALSSTFGAMVCGQTYNAALNGGLCPSSGSVRITAPPDPGEYKIALVSYVPPNEFGQDGYNVLLKESSFIAQFTVLDQGCSANSLSAAMSANNPAVLLLQAISAQSVMHNSQLAEMKARLDLLTPAISVLNMEQPAAKISITGALDSSPTVWLFGPPRQVCFRVPASSNVNPKVLVLYGGSSNKAINTGLGGAGPKTPLSSDYQGCLTITISSGVPAGKFSIKLLATKPAAVISSLSINIVQAKVRFETFSVSASSLRLGVKWEIDAAFSSPTDTVKIYNSKGDVVFWFFTSCGCTTTPGKSVPQGIVNVTIGKSNSVPGGYTVKLFPAGTDVVAAIGDSWINWKKIGW